MLATGLLARWKLPIGPSGQFSGSIPPHLTLQKREINAFSHPEADLILSLYKQDNPTFVVYGVATDYCVKAAVLRVGLIAAARSRSWSTLFTRSTFNTKPLFSRSSPAEGPY